ncbi:MAG: hypothetical protein J7530_05160 [Novosphingobium sp.]|nr:hypothetical protein [Novosphingobium sp.]
MADRSRERIEVRDILQYYGAGAAVLASLLVSLNLGRIWTGTAMAIFVSSSLALIVWGFLNPDSEGIGWQNVILLVINAIGVWRYLIVGRKKPDISPSGSV